MCVIQKCPYMMISTSLILTRILPLPVHVHIVQAFDLLAVTKKLAERAVCFPFKGFPFLEQ